MNRERIVFVGFALVFLTAYFLPIGVPEIQDAVLDAFRMLQWYARHHTLPCVVPAMFIAGAIAAFLSKEAVLKHLGPKANKAKAYGTASVSGTILAVCSCSVLPMFAGIYRIGAGLGPASAFLCSGPALNVMAIFLTARVLGFPLGAARTVGAVTMSLIVGILMAVLFRRSEEKRIATTLQLPEPAPSKRKFWQTPLFLATMIAFLVLSDWTNPGTTILTINRGATLIRLDRTRGTKESREIVLTETVRLEASISQQTSGDMKFQIQNVISGVDSMPENVRSDFLPGVPFLVPVKDVSGMEDHVPENYRWAATVFDYRWGICFFLGVGILAMAFGWFEMEELSDWMGQTWSFAKTIVPLLFGGVFVTGFVAALLPAETVAGWLGGNGFRTNFVASLVGSLWYFATLTEIPLLQALMGLGMGKGPALTLLLAGPTLSLPSVMVIGRYLGFKKTAVFVGLVVAMSALFGMVYGSLV